jgi:hypothetical protein
MRGIFISDPINGVVYVAQRLDRGCHKLKFRWSALPHLPTSGPIRIEASSVPLSG